MARILDEILKDRNIVTQKQAEKIEKNALAEAETYWGGRRANAGRKAKLQVVREINKLKYQRV